VKQTNAFYCPRCEDMVELGKAYPSIEDHYSIEHPGYDRKCTCCNPFKMNSEIGIHAVRRAPERQVLQVQALRAFETQVPASALHQTGTTMHSSSEETRIDIISLRLIGDKRLAASQVASQTKTPKKRELKKQEKEQEFAQLDALVS